ncbi:DUF4844 domain-containing protein [Flavobacterium luteolum]|uniref:DUF4844 domain-containing protein n=1 Tax=Flavobacterium luteolum TaxID=3003259 RepID=UPI00248F0D8C|nr:DUF4844 domain-containing protein [Flavobacterium luteolum]
MKQITNILIGMTLVLFIACGQGQIKTPEKAMAKFEEFKRKEKFIPDEQLFYPGIGDPTQKPILTEKINLVADDFEKLAKTGNATDKDYQNAIKIGLERFTGIYIDSENQERICYYFEELMDIVGLESSDGQLNNFRYGFDGTQKQH